MSARRQRSGEVGEGAHLVERLVGVLVGHGVRWLPTTPLAALQPEHGRLERREAPGEGAGEGQGEGEGEGQGQGQGQAAGEGEGEGSGLGLEN